MTIACVDVKNGLYRIHHRIKREHHREDVALVRLRAEKTYANPH
jgi:hypothetical protein